MKTKKGLYWDCELSKKVKGKLPVEFVKALGKYKELEQKYIEAGEKWYKAWDKYKPQIEELHEKECGCAWFSRWGIVFEEDLK